MFSYCKSKGMDWGTMDTLPEIPELALYKDGHAGYYIRNGYAVEWHGFNWGCVKTQVKKRPWKHWASCRSSITVMQLQPSLQKR